MHSALARYTNCEASTIVRSVTRLGGVQAWARLHTNYSIILGVIFRVHRECMYPKASKRRESGEARDHAVGREMESHDV